MTQNQIAYFNAKETQRHNLAMEGENAQHNRATEDIQRTTNTINQTHLSRMDVETQRHNLATEEATRKELGIKQAQLNLGIQAQAETERHNKASESLNLATLSETQRHNVATENETQRVNDSVIVKNLNEASKISTDATYTAVKTEGQRLDNQIKSATVPYAKVNAAAESLLKGFEAQRLEMENKAYPYTTASSILNSTVSTVLRGLVTGAPKTGGSLYHTNGGTSILTNKLLKTSR